ncbi:MAG TPA: D-alanyl-D-alanine carboxypeptidase/D-alanyl-D-alanine-endopeptidase [Usitatibacter sp.]|nr:D-alanyl-D-alanine carboxypeptidase/D-alanyl-D-alanine-endopeptidase [Usitatibacter sp.]
MIRLAFAALAMVIAWPAAAQLPPVVRQALDKAGVPETSVAAIVEPLDGRLPVVAHNPTAAMNPASVVKVITTFAALELLGPAFTFGTDFLHTGEIANGVLQGDLHVRGGGDPQLTYERVWQAAHALRSRGVREIHGDIVLDRSFFAPLVHDPAKFDNEPRRAYNVGADALLVNFNVVHFRFIPDARGVRVVPEPDLPNLEVASRLRPTAEPCRSFRGGITYDVVEIGLMATITFSGAYPAACGERTWALSVLDPARFTEANLRWLWSETGGVLRGKVRAGPVPPDAHPLYRHESEPLASLVRDMNKHSNNVLARHLFLALSAPAAGGAEARASAQRVAEWLRGRGIEASELRLENGSGLSREERASAATLAAILRAAWSSPVMPELVSSLPVPGVDGTLRARQGAAKGRAHLKGGTLSDVQSVAGYVLDRGGRRWIVVMMINDPRAGAAAAALDAIVEWTHEAAASARTRR